MHYSPERELEAVHWQHKVAGQLPIDVSAHLLTNAAEVDADQDALFLIPGYGELAWAAHRALDHLTDIGRKAIVGVVDTSQIPASLVDVTTFATEYTPMTVSALQERKDLPTQATALGHSMGGGILGLGIQEASELFGSVGFLEPVGHDTAARKLQQPAMETRKRTFKGEFVRVITGPYLAAPNELLHAAHDIISQLTEDILPLRDHRFDNKITLTITEDTIPAVIEHATAGNAVAYVFGGKDPLVRRDMVEQSFAEHGVSDLDALPNIVMATTKYKHAYTGWRSGNHHMDQALQLIRETEKIRDA